MIRVRALGESEILIGRRRITLSTEVIFALGLYLCLRAGERISRDEVVETFWDTRDLAKARHSLRQMLYRLRQKGFTLDEEGEELFLDPARIDCDVSRVLVESWPDTAEPADVETAGLATPSFTRQISERFQEWYDGVRSRVARQHRRAALRQIARARREGRWADLELWARHVLRSDPLNEEATLARAESAAMAGSKAMALEILDQYMEELGDRAPQIGLPATILRRRIAERRPEWAIRGPREVPLVGREELMARLTAMVDAAGRGEGRAVVLWGAPGVGKTRLSTEVRAYAQLAGFSIVRIELTPATSISPQALLMGLVSRIRELPGAAGTTPAAMAVIDRLLRETELARIQELPQESGNSDDTLLWAVHELLCATAEEGRVYVSIDDCHHTDLASLALLARIVASTSKSRVAWIVTSRRHPGRQKEQGVSTDWMLPVEVPRLDASAAHSLARALIDCGTASAAPIDAAMVARASGGNPLFIRELAQHHVSARTGEQLPRSLRELMDSRLGSLGTAETRMLRTIALLGTDATIARTQSLLLLSAADMSLLVERLESIGIVHFTESNVLALHECWHQAVIDGLTGGTRAAMSLECATKLLEDFTQFENIDTAWRAATLLATAGESLRAVKLYSQVGDDLLLKGLASHAEEAFARALELADSEKLRTSQLLRLADASHRSGNFERALSVSNEIIRTSSFDDEDSASAAAVARALAADSLWRLQRPHQAELARLASVVAVPLVHPDACQFASLFGIRLAFNDGASTHESQFYEASRRATERSGLSVVGQLVALIYCAERGSAEQVRDIDAAIEVLNAAAPTELHRTLELRVRSNALRWIGEEKRAIALATEGYTHALKLGLPDEAAGFAQQLVFQHLDECSEEEAHAWLAELERTLGTRTNPSRERALLHARARLYVQLLRYDEAIQLYKPHIESIRNDPVVKRRISDLATMGYAAAMCDSSELADLVLGEVSEVLSREPPTHQLDYPAEITVRALLALGRPNAAAAMGDDYVSRRSQVHPRPIPAYCLELRSALSRQLPMH